MYHAIRVVGSCVPVNVILNNKFDLTQSVCSNSGPCTWRRFEWQFDMNA